MTQRGGMDQFNRNANTARGLSYNHGRFSSSIAGSNHQEIRPNNMVPISDDFSPNPNVVTRAMRTNNISPPPISRYSGSNLLLLDQRWMGRGYFIPRESYDDSIIAGGGVVPPHSSNCRYNSNNFQNLDGTWRSSTTLWNSQSGGASNPHAFVQPDEYTMPSFGYIPAEHGQQYSSWMYQHYYVVSTTNHAEMSPWWPGGTAQTASNQFGSGNYNAPNGGWTIGDHVNNAAGFLANGSSSPHPPPAFPFVAPSSHQLSSIARSWIHRLNVHQEYLRMLSLENQGGGGGGGANDVAPTPPYLSDPDTLREEIRNAIYHLRNGDSIRLEELLILDYSIVLNLLDSINGHVDEDEADWDDMQYEDLVDMEDQIGNVDVGLTEDKILAHIGQETFESIANQEHQNDTCSICQDDYVDGEQIGRLDCRHGYHLKCIQHWLMIKNTCPICKQVALTIVGDEDEK